MQQLLTIPQKLAAHDDLIVMPRRHYEALLALREFKSVKLTAAQKKALIRAERNFQQGRTLSYDEFSAKLGFAR